MRLRGFIIIGAIVSIVVGFTLGKAVMGDSPAPGSSDDPVVTKSYADKAIQERVTDLEKTVAELSVQAKALQNTINELQDKINLTPSASSKPTTTPVTSQPQDKEKKEEEQEKKPEPEPQKPATSMVGKTVYINTQNYVNLRSAPTLEADVLKQVTREEGMYVQKEENGWYNVKLPDGTIGWVYSQVVKLKQ
ncbi:MAG TPA: SH3 domain-containing protein [Clostridia bacterium]|jgi:hypothetical protein|nr:SH3 domain-containing protein [Clostridia bacterium]